MWFATLLPLHTGADPAGVHPRILVVGLLLAVATAAGLYLLLGQFAPEDRASPGAGEPGSER